MSLRTQIRDLAGFLRRTERSVHQHTRQRVDHFVLLDGTMSSLAEGEETNVGLIYNLLDEVARSRRLSLYYEAGTQWSDWSKTLDVIEGRGINRRIRRAYGWLATRYRPGDRIFLIGYSRGAFAVRSLAGVIDRVGLLRQDEAIERLVQQAFRHYQFNNGGEAREVFSESHCRRDVQIEMIGCFDTVKSLGLRAPFVWKWSEIRHSFHNHQLGHHIRHGFHALALDETREALSANSLGMQTGPRGDRRAGLVSRFAQRRRRSAGRQPQGAAALEHPAYVDARADRAKRSVAAGGLAAEVSDGPRRTFGWHLVGMGQDISRTQEASVRN